MQRRVIFFCVGLCLTVGLFYWLFMWPNSVSWTLSKQMQRGPGELVDLAEVAPFAWDRVYVFAPYTSHDQINMSLGFRWDKVGRTTIDGNDGVNLVVFVRDAQVVHWFEHTRREELLDLADSNGYPRDQAKFKVCRVGADERLGLVPDRK